MAKEYKSWEILKMIQEHKLNPGDVITAYNNTEFRIGDDGCIFYDNRATGMEMPSSYLMPGHYFIIPEKEVTFMEAVNSGKLIKPITWTGYYPLNMICEKLAGNLNRDIKSLITQLWNIKEED